MRKIGAVDHIDKLLVEKYQKMKTVKCEENDKYSSIIEKFDDYLDKAECYWWSCLEEECKNDGGNNMREEEKEDQDNEELDMTNPNNYYERLGIDVLGLFIGEDIIPFVENLILPKIIDLRKKLTDEFGYIIPNIRILATSKINGNEFEILVRGKVVYKGDVDLNNDSISKYVTATEKIMNTLENVCIEHVNRIMTKTDALKLMELVRSQDPTLVNDLIPTFISAIDLKKICANLIKDKISIKDIILVFELLNDYARYTQDVTELTEKLKQEL